MQSLTKQLKDLKKRQKLEGQPISMHLRQVAQDRFQDVLKERKEQQEEQQKVKAADAEEKRALHLAKSREYLARQAAISTEQKWKKQRLEEAAADKRSQKQSETLPRDYRHACGQTPHGGVGEVQSRRCR